VEDRQEGRVPPPDNFAYEVTGNDLFGNDRKRFVRKRSEHWRFHVCGLNGPKASRTWQLWGHNLGRRRRSIASTHRQAHSQPWAPGILCTGILARPRPGCGANGDLYSINPANGAATDIGPTGLRKCCSCERVDTTPAQAADALPPVFEAPAVSVSARARRR
jgi:hypothetical protein